MKTYGRFKSMTAMAAVLVWACAIDDCGLIYKCVFCPPHVPELESMESTCEKIRALVGERYNSDFMIFGRASSYACTKFHSEQERRGGRGCRPPGDQQSGP